MKLDVVKIVKVIGFAMSIGGSIAGSWVSKKENNKILEELVKKHHKSK